MTKAACASAFVLAFAALAAPAFAAQDGALGPNSTGSFDVSVTVDLVDESQVRVSGLNDIDFGVIDSSFTPPYDAWGRACFYHTSPTFSLTITGPGGATPLTITDGQGGSASLSLSIFSDFLFSEVFTTTGGTTTGLVGNTVSETCATGDLSPILAQLNPVTLANGFYSTTVNLVMAAE